MATIKEKIAYLRGLMEGSDFVGQDTHAQAVWNRLLEILDDLSDQVEALRVGLEETDEYLEALDSDLSDVEDEVYGDPDDDDDDDDDEVEFVEMECPDCHETVYFEREFLDDDDVEISCPECGRVLYSSEPDDDSDDGELGNGRAHGSIAKDIAKEPTTP